MQGAEKRDRAALARTARAVWVGFNASGDQIDDFIALTLDPDAADAPQTPEQALAVLSAQTAALPKLTLAEALQRMH